MSQTTDIYKVVQGSGVIRTRNGHVWENHLTRNGVVIVSGTRKECLAEAKLRRESARNPLAGINGTIG